MHNQFSHLVECLDNYPEQGVLTYLDKNIECIKYPTIKRHVLEKMEELRKFGVVPGMNIAIAAKNSYAWIVADFAVLALNCDLVAIPEESGKNAAILDEYGIHLLLISAFDDIMGLNAGGSVAFIDAPNPPDIRVRDNVPLPQYGSDAFSITFSSGTSGDLKAMIMSRDGTQNWIRHLVSNFSLNSEDAILVFLPFSHFQQRMLLYVAALAGMDFMLTNPERLFGALPKLRPTLLVAPPMFYESVETRVRSLHNAIDDHVQVRKKIEEVLGSRIRLIFTGFAPIRKNTLEFYEDAGLPLYEGYGVTECGQVCLNTPTGYRLGSVGKPVDDADVHLGDDGEIMVRKKHPLSLGYVGKARDTENTVTVGNYFLTGDIGRFDEDGFLYVIGRKKQLIVTRGGYKVHPQILEESLDSCAYINKSVVFGSGMPSLVALISVSPTITEMEKKQIQEHIDKLNNESVSARHIGRVVFTDTSFDEESGFLTRSLKLNRSAVFDAYKSEIIGNWVVS